MISCGVSSALGSSSCGGSLTPISFACSMSPGAALLPSPLRVLPTTSSSICHFETGKAVKVAHV